MLKHIVSFLSVLLVILASGCGRGKSREIKIGILTPLTGDVSSWGAMQKRSTELALEKVNGEGGIDGENVRVIYEDDQANPKVGLNAFKKLAEVDQVPIVVGSPASNVTLAVAQTANEDKVVLLSSGSTATDVGKAGPYVFRIMPSDEVQSTIMAKWTFELGFNRVAIIYEENAWGQGLMNSFKEDFPKDGGKIVSIEGVPPSCSDFRTVLSKIKGEQPDAIFAPVYTRGAGLMIKQARQLGIKQQFLGADVYNTPELVAAGGTAVNGTIYTTFGKYGGPEFQGVTNAYKAKYGIDMETYASYCYDAFMIAVKAIRDAKKGGDVTGESVRKNILALIDYHGVTGLSDFSGKNSASGKTFDKMIVKEGKHVLYQ